MFVSKWNVGTIVFTAGILLAVGLAIPAEAAPVTITYWNGITANDREGQEFLVNKFNQQYAGKIKVDMTIMPWGDWYTKVPVAVAAGTAPDVGLMHLENIPSFVLQGILRPVDDIFERIGLTDNDFIGGMSRESVYRGKRWGIPLDIHCLLLYYNQNHLDKAGISGPPQRSKEFLDYARKLTVDKNGDGTPEQWGTRLDPWMWRFYQMIRQFGGNFFGGPDFATPMLTEPAAQKAFQYHVDLIYKYKVAAPPGVGQFDDMFRDQVSLWVDGIWWLTYVQDMRRQGKLDIRVGRSDRLFGDVQPATYAGSHQFVVLKQPKEDPAKIQAITAFIDFMSRNSATWASYGQIPVRLAALRSEEWQKLTDHHIIASQTFVFLPPQPWGGGLGVVDDILWKLLRDRAPLENTLKTGQEELATRVKQMREELGI